jgi:hypothetical protein
MILRVMLASGSGPQAVPYDVRLTSVPDQQTEQTSYYVSWYNGDATAHTHISYDESTIHANELPGVESYLIGVDSYMPDVWVRHAKNGIVTQWVKMVT